jgi:hypothetical protein
MATAALKEKMTLSKGGILRAFMERLLCKSGIDAMIRLPKTSPTAEIKLRRTSEKALGEPELDRQCSTVIDGTGKRIGVTRTWPGKRDRRGSCEGSEYNCHVSFTIQIPDPRKFLCARNHEKVFTVDPSCLSQCFLICGG